MLQLIFTEQESGDFSADFQLDLAVLSRLLDGAAAPNRLDKGTDRQEFCEVDQN